MSSADEQHFEKLQRHLEEVKQRAESLRHELQDKQFSGTSRDKMVTVTVTASGQLVDVDINPRVIGGHTANSKKLGAAVVEAANAATAKVSGQMNERLRPVFGDSFDASAIFSGDSDFDEVVKDARRQMP